MRNTGLVVNEAARITEILTEQLVTARFERCWAPYSSTCTSSMCPGRKDTTHLIFSMATR